MQISRCDTHFGQFKEENLMQLAFFFLGRNRNFVYHTDFAADELRSHVTIYHYLTNHAMI